MKILHVTPWYEPAWSTGGTAISASNICRAQANLGHEVTVFTTTEAGNEKVLYNKQQENLLGV